MAGSKLFICLMLIIDILTHRFKELASSPPPHLPERPENASLPQVTFESLVGKYNNPGYGSFELCLVSPNHTMASRACKYLAARAPIILPGVIDPNIPTFLIEWDSAAAPYVIFTHFNGNIFHVTVLASYVRSILVASELRINKISAHG